jgi:hypothetical protein
MAPTYEVYRELPNGFAALVHTARNLTEARLVLTGLVLDSPGGYFIYSKQSGHVVENFKWSEYPFQSELVEGETSRSRYLH